MRNMMRRFFLVLGYLAFGSASTVATPAPADGPALPFAILEATGGSLEWTAAVRVESATLVVSDPDGFVRSIRFDPGDRVTLPLIDEGGVPLDDGSYTWELRLQPPASLQVQQAIEVARGAGDARRLARLQRLTAPWVQTGHFTIENGSAAETGTVEPAESGPVAETAAVGNLPPKDQTVADDLVVDGKGCIGLACNPNESFGAEALRLKQSVVRLRFEDTSSAGGFPGRDWQLTANDAGSGGVDKFSIEDLTGAKTPFTVVGGAPENSLYVDASGRLGLGTATPAQGLHVAASSTPTVRLDQTGGTPRIWDVGASNSNFFVKDVTGSSAIPFRIAAGATSSSVDVGAAGKVGIGTDPSTFSDAVLLTVKGSAPLDALIKVQNTSGSGFSGLQFHNSAGTPGFFFGVNNSNDTTRLNSFSGFPFIIMTDSVERIYIEPGGLGGDVGIGTTTPTSKLHVNGSVTAAGYITASSRSLKDGFVTVDRRDLLRRLADVPISTWYFRSDSDHLQHIGPTAEDFQAAFGLGQIGSGLSLPDSAGIALAAIQGLYAELQELKRVTAEQSTLIEEQHDLIEELRRGVDGLSGAER